MMELSFFGAAGTVTGSRHLLETGGKRILVDCGLFQGLKQLRLRNWAAFPVPPSTIDAVVLTHAHLDHSGYLPRLARDGFRGPVYATPATIDLCRLLLLDSAHIQESDADFANRHQLSRHQPALPLYTVRDVEQVLKQFVPVPFDHTVDVSVGASVLFQPAGHILGASVTTVVWKGRRLVFSGDLGRYNDPVMVDPVTPQAPEFLVLESTYGNRRHDAQSPKEVLRDIIERTTQRGGTVLIPSFAVGRAQLLLFLLHELRHEGKISSRLPIYLDSPMAASAVDIYERHVAEQRLTRAQCEAACAVATYIQSVEESKALDQSAMPKIIISASGMATGGRVLHHLKRYAPDPRSTVLFAGFQAAGTRGAKMLDGAESVKIHGEYVPIRAELDNLSMLSAHADADEIIRWLQGFSRPPRRTFLVHGEPEAADTLRLRIKDELGWECQVAEHLERVALVP
ncbi:MAG: MBL fold metallo-hydrolase RNA specificity domain-containing protein [Burkholderiaceae bacterium]